MCVCVCVCVCVLIFLLESLTILSSVLLFEFSVTVDNKVSKNLYRL